jgi:hypothetical protein
MGFFPPNMYDPQINMIRKPFELNKKRLKKDFNSLKYEKRRKEFFATFSEFLRSYIRDKYYEFMNDIQTEVNFFEWFDHYFKPKLLAGRNTNTNNPLLQKEVIKNSFLQKEKTSPDNVSIVTRPFPTSLISQNNIPTPNNQTLTTFDPCHAPSLTITDNSTTTQILMPIKNTSHQISNFPCTKTNSRELSDNSYTRQIILNQQVTDKNLTKKQM